MQSKRQMVTQRAYNLTQYCLVCLRLCHFMKIVERGACAVCLCRIVHINYKVVCSLLFESLNRWTRRPFGCLVSLYGNKLLLSMTVVYEDKAALHINAKLEAKGYWKVTKMLALLCCDCHVWLSVCTSTCMCAWATCHIQRTTLLFKII